MPTYPNFYSNVCRLLGSINSGICHNRAAVKLPLSKVGLELSYILRNLGIIADFSVGQRVSRVKGHSRLWDPSVTRISSSEEAAGYPAMYLTLQLNWDKYKPIYSTAQLAAAPSSAPPAALAASSASSSSNAEDQPKVTPPMGINSPTPERVKIISKPSHQRRVGVSDLLRLRAASPPGVYLLHTRHGLITDIDAELRGTGGTLLAYLQLPLGHVMQLRGLLRAKHNAEVAAAKPQQQQMRAAIRGPGPHTDLHQSVRTSIKQSFPPQHQPLAQWDARKLAEHIVMNRLNMLSGLEQNEGSGFLEHLDEVDAPRAELSKAVGKKLDELQLQELAWQQAQQGQQRMRSRHTAQPSRARTVLGQ